MIHYNDPTKCKERQKAKPLTLEEENQIILIINDSIEDFCNEYYIDLIQRFIYNYENNKHHATTCQRRK